MRDLEKRRQFWSHRDVRVPLIGHDLTDSLPYPFEDAGIEMIFNGKDVLEIGPGNGRQYERLKHRVKTYAIADISQRALDEPVFGAVDGRILLEDWEQYLISSYDVIHFWYVLHHVRHCELRGFFAFIARHLDAEGLAAFNSPEPVNVQGAPEGDGIGTTWTDPGIVQAALPPSLELLMAANISRKSTGHVFLVRKVAR